MRQPLPDGDAVAIGLERSRKVTLVHLHVADLVVSSGKAKLIAGFVGFRGGETGQQMVGLLGAAALLAGVPEGSVIAGELDQHPCLLKLQFGRGPAVVRHVVEQAFRLAE